MKYIIGLFCMLFPVFARAQTKIHTDSTARSTLNDLMDSWTLGIGRTGTIDLKIYNKFKSLFDANATIDDDFNVFYAYDPKRESGSYKVRTGARPKTFDVYAHDIALQIRGIIIDSVTVLNSSTTDEKNMSFTVKRKVQVQKTRKYVLPATYAEEVINSRTIEFRNKEDSLTMDSDLKAKVGANREAVYEFTSINTLRITMTFETDAMRITGIKSIANEVVCNNDTDYDAVLNPEDSLENRFGDFTANGKPDYDLDGLDDINDKCRITYGNLHNRGCPISRSLRKKNN